MKIDRAKQILGSNNRINVSYNGKPVWLVEVYETTGTARVHLESTPDKAMDVRLDELQE